MLVARQIQNDERIHLRWRMSQRIKNSISYETLNQKISLKSRHVSVHLKSEEYKGMSGYAFLVMMLKKKHPKRLLASQ